MKIEISIKLSKTVLTQVDPLARSKRSRSAVIERMLREFLIERKEDSLHARDLEQINRLADPLNLEAAKVLEYQNVEESLEDMGEFEADWA